MKTPLAIVCALCTSTSLASAQEPKFEYGKKEEVKGVEWKASAQAGLLLTTGNSKSTTFSAGAMGSRKEGRNKLELNAGAAYARSSVYLAIDDDGDGAIGEDEIQRPASTTTRSWLVKARYDRFLTDNNSLYVLAIASADVPAGKDFVGGGQAGYSRQLYKTDKHRVVVEGGYDFSYEDLTAGDSSSIHSVRLFSGYEGVVRTDTSVLASVEFLANMNSLSDDVGAFDDRRTTGALALTTKVYEDISFRFSFTAKHDSAPAPRPPFSIPYEAGFLPLADELDTKTEATLIINFL